MNITMNSITILNFNIFYIQYNRTSMPKIPIWKTNFHQLSIDHQNNIEAIIKLALINHDHLHLKQKFRNVYLDQNIGIWSIEEPKSNQCSYKQQEYLFSILVTIRHNYQVYFDNPIYSCIPQEQGKYFLLSQNISGRYQVTLYDSINNQSQQIAIQGVKPYRKTNPIFQYNSTTKTLWVISNKTGSLYQRTSPVWVLNLTTKKWKQIQLSKAGMEAVGSGWVFWMSGILYVLKENRLQIFNGDQAMNINLEGLVVDTERDLYSVTWNDQKQYYLIKIYRHGENNANQRNILLKLSKNSIHRIDLGIYLDADDWEKQPNFKNSINLGKQPENHPFINSSTHITENNNLIHLFTTRSMLQLANSIQIQYYQHTIQLQKLQILLTLSSPNIELSQYFSDKKYKGYTDLILITEKKEVFCSKDLFQFYSPKFKKLYSNTSNSKNFGEGPINVRLDQAKMHTVYFLVEQLYHKFRMPLTDLDQTIILDLMILSQKFQIRKLQSLCQSSIEPTIQNFSRLYDYIRNSETHQFKQMVIRFFVIHSQQLIKTMPIGKIEELIRTMYTPECQHSNWTSLNFKIENKYTITSSDKHEKIENPKNINYPPLVKNEQSHIHICDKCRKVLDYCQQHRKNKSINRSNVSAISVFQNHKKDVNSN